MSQATEIVKESLRDGLNALTGTATTAESRLPDWPIRKYLVIRAADANTDAIFISPPGNSANGFKLAAGERSPLIRLDNANKVAVTAASGTQHFTWLGQ